MFERNSKSTDEGIFKTYTILTHGPERSIPRYDLVLNNSLRYLRRYAPCMPRLVMPPIACDTVQLAFLRTSTTASDVVESPIL